MSKIAGLLLTVLCLSLPSCGGTTSIAPDTAGSLTTMVRQAEKSSNLIVFVHGVLGDPRATWLNTSSGNSWPEMVAGDSALSDFDVMDYGFQTSLRGKGQTVADLADHLKLHLANPDVFNRYRQVVFVCHSMGGLVVREFLNRYSQQLNLTDRVPMLFLVSVPSNGSVVAEAARVLTQSKQMVALERLPDNLWLQANQQNWLANPLSKKAKTYCAVETEKTYGAMIVGRDSAIPFCTEGLLAIPRNHIDIAKPATTKDDIYIGLLVALQETVLKDKAVRLSQDTLVTLVAQLRAGFPLNSYVVHGAVNVASSLADDDTWTVGNLIFEAGSSLLVGSKNLTIDVKGRLQLANSGQEIIRSFLVADLASGNRPAKPTTASAGGSPQGEGAAGLVGQPGISGVPGTDGRSSGNVTVWLRNPPSESFKVALLGQSGGLGGDGGDGGPGSNGTKGTAGRSGIVGCDAGGGNGGPGGNGGAGGSAGLGGAPGAGGVLAIVLPVNLAADLGGLVAIESTPAAVGSPGAPGSGGPLGNGGQAGNGAGFCGGGGPGGPGHAGTTGSVPNDSRSRTGQPPTLVFRTMTTM